MQSEPAHMHQCLSELTADILKALAAKLSPPPPLQHGRSRHNYQLDGRRPKSQGQQEIYSARSSHRSRSHNDPKRTTTFQGDGRSRTPKEIAVNKIRSNEKILILMRGCSGCGKTTLANQLVANGVVYSADDYFVRNGRYEFDPGKLNEAHAQVRSRCLRAMESDRTPVIVDNTNLEAWEMIPYVSMGLKHQYFIHLLEPETPWRYNAAQLTVRNRHHIGHATIVRMLATFDRNITAFHLIKSCKMSANPDGKPIRSPRKQNDISGKVDGGLKQQKLKFATDLPTYSDEGEDLTTPHRPDRFSSPPDRNDSITNTTDLLDLNNFFYPTSTSKSNDTKASNNVGSISKIGFIQTDRTADVDEEMSQFEDPIAVLKSYFADVPHDVLVDVYSRCQGDVQHVVSLLLEAGYQIVQSSERTSRPIESDIDLIDFSDSASSKLRIPAILVTPDEGEQNDVSSTTFTFRLDAGFAKLLQDRFGPVGLNSTSDSYSGSELDVTIPLQLAAAIHHCWSVTLCEKFQREEAELVEMMTDEGRVGLYEDYEDAFNSDFYPDYGCENVTTSTPPPTGEPRTLANDREFASMIEQIPEFSQHNVYGGILNSHNCNGSVIRLLHEEDNLTSQDVDDSPDVLQLAALQLTDQVDDCGEVVEEPLTVAQLRDHSQQLLVLRKEYFDKAKSAMVNGLKEAASYYSQKGHEYTNVISVTNEQASELILEIMNGARHLNTLDLHLMTSREAMKALTEFLSQKQMKVNASNSIVLYIITGRGNKGSAIKHVVYSYLKSKNYSCYQINADCVEVVLRTTVRGKVN